MNYTSSCINPIEFDIEEISTFNFFDYIFFQFKTNGGFQLPYNIEPTKGEHDFNNCKDCQENLLGITNALTDKFNGKKGKKQFPSCCTYHENLIKLENFDRDLFAGVPAMVAKKVVYTRQHITNNYKSPNWYKRITDYIDFVIDSFGRMPVNCGESLYLGEYYYQILHDFKAYDDFTIEKKDAIFDFIISKQNPSPDPEFDFITLFRTYHTWINEFPFELNNYFGDKKIEFINSLPFIAVQSEPNIYSGVRKTKIHSQNSLVTVLFNLTRELLSAINVKHLVEKGIITDFNKHRFELGSESLRIATSKLTKDFTKGELKYIETINKWLHLQKAFFKEIEPLFKAKTSKVIVPDINESEQYIKHELIDKLNKIESKMQPTLLQFKHSKIKCASWVELLMDRKYFYLQYQKTKRKSCINFAAKRYGIDITTQMNSGNKNDRDTHKELLSKHFK